MRDGLHGNDQTLAKLNAWIDGGNWTLIEWRWAATRPPPAEGPLPGSTHKQWFGAADQPPDAEGRHLFALLETKGVRADI